MRTFTAYIKPVSAPAKRASSAKNKVVSKNEPTSSQVTPATPNGDDAADSVDDDVILVAA